MNELLELPGDEFERHRSRLFGLAYRMLSSRAEAEDVVQETFLRWHQSNRESIRNTEAWLVTAATRIAIDRLRALKREREAYTGPWLPEPLMADHPPAPDHAAELASDLSIAFLMLLERLAPDERAAFLLHDVFDCGYDDIARILEKSEAACRQIVHRARSRVRNDQKRFTVSESTRASLLSRFNTAVEASDEATLLSLFAPDATWTADSGGKVPAAPRPLVGAARIVKLLMGLQRLFRDQATLDLITVNGETGVALRHAGRLIAILSADTDGERILAVYATLNPEKLGLSKPS